MILYKVTQRYAANMTLVIEACRFCAFRSPQNGHYVHSYGICNSTEFHGIILSIVAETVISKLNLKGSIHFTQTYKTVLSKASL